MRVQFGLTRLPGDSQARNDALSSSLFLLRGETLGCGQRLIPPVTTSSHRATVGVFVPIPGNSRALQACGRKVWMAPSPFTPLAGRAATCARPCSTYPFHGAPPNRTESPCSAGLAPPGAAPFRVVLRLTFSARTPHYISPRAVVYCYNVFLAGPMGKPARVAAYPCLAERRGD